MQELEKILEEIKTSSVYAETADKFGAMCVSVGTIERIISKHMNDEWIQVEKEWPPFGQRLQATILHHEWVSDYDSAWVPDEEKVYHPAYTEVCEIYYVGGIWYYACAEDDYDRDFAYIDPLKDLSSPVAEIIAWRHLPESYCQERSKE